MPAIGLVLLWGGYSLAYYGFNRITGGNDTFKSLVWPGAYEPKVRDDGTGAQPVGPINKVPTSGGILGAK